MGDFDAADHGASDGADDDQGGPSGGGVQGGLLDPKTFPWPILAAEADPRTGLVNSLRFKPTVIRAPGHPASNESGSTFGYELPPYAGPGIHGHIDGGPYESEVFVDVPSRNGGWGDAVTLKPKYQRPMATVSHGQVGWHVLDQGQLKFIYPEGSMSFEQIDKMQKNLDQEQKNFLRGK